MAKSLVEKIVEIYPELAGEGYRAFEGRIIAVQDDSDGEGAYIAVWNYEKPVPDGMKLGK
jgi:hypothetical protein